MLTRTLLFVGLVLTAPQQAVSADADECKTGTPEIGIPACQRMLQRSLTKQDKISITAKISSLYAVKGDSALALEWANRAIAVDPTAYLGYYVRGGAQYRRKAFEQAVTDLDRSIAIKNDYGWSYHYRALAYRGLGKLDTANQDHNTAIRLEPRNPLILSARAITLSMRGELDKSLADTRRALELAPADAKVLAYSAVIWSRKGDFERAWSDIGRAKEADPRERSLAEAQAMIAFYAEDYQQSVASASEAIGLDPTNSSALGIRALAYTHLKQGERGRTDATRALQLDPRNVAASLALGKIELETGANAGAIRHAAKAIELDPISVAGYRLRAEAYQQSGNEALALADVRKVLSLKARTPAERNAQLASAQLLNATDAKRPSQDDKPLPHAQPMPPPGRQEPEASPREPSRRVALIIANGRYESIGELANPVNDSKLIAASLRSVGFGDVDTRVNLTLKEMIQALKEFGDKAVEADWAIIYFAGHGIEMNGIPYLIPIDARLLRDTHIPDETVALDRFLQKTENAKRMRLVILDACRNNPFSTRMVRSAGATRSIGRGLPALEVEGDVLVAYATKHGTFALDGEGANSPYALALAKHIPTPDLDIRVMFGQVRDTVRQTTKNQQEPYTYGSIGGELHYFMRTR